MRVLVTLFALSAALPAWGAGLDLRLHRDGEAVLIDASATVAADLRTAWTVLTDYERYPEFVPDLHASRVRAREPGGLVVEQSGDARFLLMLRRVEATLAVREVPFRSVTSVAIAGDFRELAGRYEVAPTGAGTHFSYSGRFVPADGAPNWITTAVLKWNIERQLAALVREMRRRGALAGHPSSPASAR